MTTQAPDELFSVLESIRPALKSVDLRIVAVTPPSKEDWQNLVTSIVVSDKSRDKVRNEHEKFPVIRNNYFAIFFQDLPFDYEIFDQISKGEIKFFMPYGRTKIQCRNFDPLKLKVNSIQEWIERHSTWILKATQNGSVKEREELWSAVQKQKYIAKRCGYPNIEELISKALRIKFRQNQPLEFMIVIPPLARIQSANFVKNQFEVEVRKPSNLEGLQLNLTWGRAKNSGYHKTVERIPPRVLSQGEPELDENYCIVKEVFELDNLVPYDRMEAELILRESALTLDKIDRRAPLENIVEPFLKTLGAFCSFKEFKMMLLEPDNYGRPPEKIFEIAVSWLLSLAGFSTIYLGRDIKIPKSSLSKKFHDRKFDVLLSKSGLPIGCADIIAYEDNEKLLLIDCDIGEIVEEKIQKLVSTKNYFDKSLKNFSQLEIIPVLFSPKDLRKQDNAVKIVDRALIETILKEVVKGGNREYVRSLFY